MMPYLPPLIFLMALCAASQASGDVLKPKNCTKIGALTGFLENGESFCCTPTQCHTEPELKGLPAQGSRGLELEEFRRFRSSIAGVNHKARSKRQSGSIRPQQLSFLSSLIPPLAQMFEIHQTSDEGSTETCVEPACVQETLPCCNARIELSLPLFGLSATTGQEISILQTAPLFLQPVVRVRCAQQKSNVFSGICRQVYVPVLLYVQKTMSNFSLQADYVMIEGGCECILDPVGRLHHLPLSVVTNPILSQTFANSFQNGRLRDFDATSPQQSRAAQKKVKQKRAYETFMHPGFSHGKVPAARRNRKIAAMRNSTSASNNTQPHSLRSYGVAGGGDYDYGTVDYDYEGNPHKFPEDLIPPRRRHNVSKTSATTLKSVEETTPSANATMEEAPGERLAKPEKKSAASDRSKSWMGKQPKNKKPSKSKKVLVMSDIDEDDYDQSDFYDLAPANIGNKNAKDEKAGNRFIANAWADRIDDKFHLPPGSHARVGGSAAVEYDYYDNWNQKNNYSTFLDHDPDVFKTNMTSVARMKTPHGRSEGKGKKGKEQPHGRDAHQKWEDDDYVIQSPFADLLPEPGNNTRDENATFVDEKPSGMFAKNPWSIERMAGKKHTDVVEDPRERLHESPDYENIYEGVPVAEGGKDLPDYENIFEGVNGSRQQQRRINSESQLAQIQHGSSTTEPNRDHSSSSVSPDMENIFADVSDTPPGRMNTPSQLNTSISSATDHDLSTPGIENIFEGVQSTEEVRPTSHSSQRPGETIIPDNENIFGGVAPGSRQQRMKDDSPGTTTSLPSTGSTKLGPSQSVREPPATTTQPQSQDVKATSSQSNLHVNAGPSSEGSNIDSLEDIFATLPSSSTQGQSVTSQPPTAEQFSSAKSDQKDSTPSGITSEQPQTSDVSPTPSIAVHGSPNVQGRMASDSRINEQSLPVDDIHMIEILQSLTKTNLSQIHGSSFQDQSDIFAPMPPEDQGNEIRDHQPINEIVLVELPDSAPRNRGHMRMQRINRLENPTPASQTTGGSVVFTHSSNNPPARNNTTFPSLEDIFATEAPPGTQASSKPGTMPPPPPDQLSPQSGSPQNESSFIVAPPSKKIDDVYVILEGDGANSTNHSIEMLSFPEDLPGGASFDIENIFLLSDNSSLAPKPTVVTKDNSSSRIGKAHEANLTGADDIFGSVNDTGSTGNSSSRASVDAVDAPAVLGVSDPLENLLLPESSISDMSTNGTHPANNASTSMHAGGARAQNPSSVDDLEDIKAGVPAPGASDDVEDIWGAVGDAATGQTRRPQSNQENLEDIFAPTKSSNRPSETLNQGPNQPFNFDQFQFRPAESSPPPTLGPRELPLDLTPPYEETTAVPTSTSKDPAYFQYHHDDLVAAEAGSGTRWDYNKYQAFVQESHPGVHPNELENIYGDIHDSLNVNPPSQRVPDEAEQDVQNQLVNSTVVKEWLHDLQDLAVETRHLFELYKSNCTVLLKHWEALANQLNPNDTETEIEVRILTHNNAAIPTGQNETTTTPAGQGHSVLAKRSIGEPSSGRIRRHRARRHRRRSAEEASRQDQGNLPEKALHSRLREVWASRRLRSLPTKVHKSHEESKQDSLSRDSAAAELDDLR